MNGEPLRGKERVRCTRNHCTGTLEDGYCDVCGLAAIATSRSPQPSARVTSRSVPVTTGTGSSPLTRASKGSRRTHSTSARSTRRQLGAGLISIPELPSTEPEKAILMKPKFLKTNVLAATAITLSNEKKAFVANVGRNIPLSPLCNREM